MSRGNKRTWLAGGIILSVIILDQWLKLWVKTSFYLGEEMVIFPWFRLLFVQNPGMAFGWSLGSKLVLTLFRYAATIFGFWYLIRIFKRPVPSTGLIVCVSLILAGAIGNLIDCTFYGLIFDNPMPPEIASLFPAAGGYAQVLHGQVVDMLYFPLFNFVWPDWMPGVGGTEFEFFRPIFNIADAAVSVGVIVLILFYSSQLNPVPEPETDAKTEE